jgi:hypothetical protein
VDCSLLTPPRDGSDGRPRYSMLETLRAYGAEQLAEAGEQDQAAAALAGYALGVAEEAAAGLQTRTGEREAARRLDAEEATMRQVLAWAMSHDPEVALRLAGALGWWWFLQGRLAGQGPLLAAVTGNAEPGSDQWCAAQFMLAWATYYSGDMAGAVEHFTALRGAVAARPPSPALADALAGRAFVLRDLGQIPEATEEARRALAVVGGVGHPFGEALALLGPRSLRRGRRGRGRGGAAGPAGCPGPRRRPRLDNADMRHVLGPAADRGRRVRRCRACLRGRAGCVPGHE